MAWIIRHPASPLRWAQSQFHKAKGLTKLDYFEKSVTPDFEGLRRNILREAAPRRVHSIELMIDTSAREEMIERFGLARGLVSSDPFYGIKRDIALHRFLGFDTVYRWTVGFDWPLDTLHLEPDSGESKAGRQWQNVASGPVRNWETFDRYPWPSARNIDLTDWEWAERNLPDDMAMVVFTGNIFERVSQLMGYETLCLALYDSPELVGAMFDKVGKLFEEQVQLMVQFSRVGVIWGSDDMGFKTQTLLPPPVMKAKCLSWHARLANIAHEAGKLYFLHSCGNLDSIIDFIIDDVRADAKHSFEDAIIPITEAKKIWGNRIALLGGFDLDLLCRSDEETIRKHTREILDICMPGGGYCLGTGNSVPDYLPLENYLIMLDEGRRYC